MASYPFKIRVAPDVISQEVQLGETLLLDVKTLVYYGLDELGTKLWCEIQRNADGDAAFSALLDATALPAGQLATKFTAILGALEKSGLIELEPLFN